jgi:hypothetical protein
MHYRTHDIGSQLRPVNGGIVNYALTTGSTANNDVEKSGTAINRIGANGNNVYRSAVVSIPYKITVIAAKQCTLGMNLQHSSLSSAGWADYDSKAGTTAKTVTVTGTSVAVTGTNVLTENYDLGNAKKYIRVQAVINYQTSAGVDAAPTAGAAVAVSTPTVILSGDEVYPA